MLRTIPQTLTIRPSETAVTNTVRGRVPLAGMRGYSIHALFTGSDVAGTLLLQVSNAENTTADTKWVDLANSSISVTNSASQLYSLECQYKWVRAKWTYGSGTGLLTILFYNNGV